MLSKHKNAEKITMKPTLYLLALTSIALPLFAKGLTPERQPLNNSYYVCYEKRIPVNVKKFVTKHYHSLHYQGCTITLDECLNNEKKQKLKQFGWFNNYNDAINAFYRCAYSS